MSKSRAWLQALRLRTLPLSISGILMGLALSPKAGTLFPLLGLFCLVTTLLFQILSNLANDLGDSIKGTDNAQRIGPTRAVQSGIISKKAMKNAVLFTALLSLISSAILICLAFNSIRLNGILIYSALALLCILAAIAYTMGKHAYGYLGLGDLMVFSFFGVVGVLGTRHLMSSEWNLSECLAAIAVGCLSCAVLNLNNMRDRENDGQSGKKTLAVRLGFMGAKRYHMGLISLASIAWLGVLTLNYINQSNGLVLACALPLIPLIKHSKVVIQTKEPKDFDPELKKVAFSCFLSALSFYVYQILSLWF